MTAELCEYLDYEIYITKAEKMQYSGVKSKEKEEEILGFT